jgi:hypothetical protein
MAMLELARERPVLLAVEEFDRFNRQISLCGTSLGRRGVCGALPVPARRAAGPGRGGNQPKSLLTLFSVIFLPATLIPSMGNEMWEASRLAAVQMDFGRSSG